VGVKTPDESGDEFTLATYEYDALGRRISKVVDNISAFSGTTYYYYNKKWQMIESHDGSENLDTQVIFGVLQAPASPFRLGRVQGRLQRRRDRAVREAGLRNHDRVSG
jgi:hypothetical protein